MNPEIKKQWADALRSGVFEQGKGHLNKYGEYCCLGVLCELHSRASGTQWEARDPYGAGSSYCGEVAILPREVIVWAGFEDHIDWYDVGQSIGQPRNVSYAGRVSSLTQLNDDGVSFIDIANVIEAQL